LKTKLNSIQDLRGFAVLYVMLFHAGNIFGYHIFVEGHTGVNLFFVISGFIISYIHKDDKGLEKGIVFAKKRVARIYSPYIIPFLVMFAMFMVSGKGGEFHRDIFNIIRNVLLVHNPSQSILPYSWSLVYEIYYYATFLLVVILLKRNLVQYCLIMALPIIIINFFPVVEVTRDFVPLNFRNLFFISGALLGHYYKSDTILFDKAGLLVGASIFIAAPFLTTNSWILLLATVSFFFVTLHTEYSHSSMRFFGNASYSLYLIHALVLSALKTVIPYRNFFWFLVFISACIICGSLHFLFVEKKLISVSYRWLGLAKRRSEKVVLANSLENVDGR
jgi:exopolysaccharide production protein ExoZ